MTKSLIFTSIDKQIQSLNTNRQIWAELSIEKKIIILQNIRLNLGVHAKEWVNLSVKNKQLDPKSPFVGEEWSTGPWALAYALTAYEESLRAIQKGKLKNLIKKIAKRPNGQLKLKVFPSNIYDSLLFNGIEAEVWLQKSVNESNLGKNMGVFYQNKSPKGKLSLVLGAGNINSIPPLDLLYNLYVKGEVVLLKMNPINEYLTPVFEKVFAPLIQANFLKITTGGTEVGKYLTSHANIECIHITGSEHTHDVIVYGNGEDSVNRKKENKPILDPSKPITSELGGVSPLIVIPGPWSNADIKYQAKNIISAKLHNGGHNCAASQLLVLPKKWDKSDELLQKVEELMSVVKYRPAYYPGSSNRQKGMKKAYPQAKELVGDVPRTIVTGLQSDNKKEYAFNTEFFGAMLAQTTIEGDSATEYFKNVVQFCNENLHGTLGTTILVHPKTIKEMGADFENSLSELKYGSIGINIWHGVIFLVGQCSWGAYPGHTYDDIQSGIGVVHNSLMFENVERSVMYGYFRPSPRAMNLAPPTPPWFVTNTTAAKTMKKITSFAIEPSIMKLPGIFASALATKG